MDEDNLQSETTTVENFWRDEDGVNEMASRESFHLEAAYQIEQRIEAIQRSTRSDFSSLSRAHNYLRLKFRWYYKWHTLKATNAVHYAILGVAMVWVLVEVYLLC